MADTISGAVERGAVAQFGGIDVVVGSPLPFSPSLAAELAALPEAQAQHARSVPTLGVPGSVTNPALQLAQSNVVVRGVDSNETALLGPLRTASGEPVAEPRAGEVVLSQTLADALHAKVGDEVVLRVPRFSSLTAGALRIGEIRASVSGIAVQEGRSGYVGTSTALVPLDVARNATGAPGRATQLLFVVDGHARDVATSMREHLRANGDRTFDARADKALILETTRSSQNYALGIILGMSSFTLLAAVLLAYALLSAIVEERRLELGVMRALGLTRGEVALVMTLEGAYYALAAALVGLALGLAALVGAVALLAARVPDQFRRYIAVEVAPGTVALALAIGVLVPLVTIAAGSLRFARLDPSRAIRGIPDDPKGERRLGLGLAATVTGIGLTAILLPFGHLAGIPVALAGGALALQALDRRRLAILPLAAGAATLVYTLYTYEFPRGSAAFDPAYTLGRGVLLALGLVALAVASPRPYDALAAGARARNSVLVAVRYLMAKRRAAGLTMAMIAIVVMVVTVMGTLFTLFASRAPDELGGYEIQGTSPLPFDALSPPIPANLSAKVADVELLPRVARTGFNLSGPHGDVGGFAGLWGIPPGFANNTTLAFGARDARYASDADAWRAVARGEAIAAADFDRPNPARLWNLTPGDAVRLRAPGGVERNYTFAGYVRTSNLGLMLGAQEADSLGVRSTRVVLVRVAPGADPEDVAGRLTNTYQSQGLAFETFRALNEARVQQAQPLLLVVEAFLGVGLMVGLSSTGILASRAVHERRREIGTLRALGFEEADVRRAFLLESTMTTLVGLVVGLGVGLVVAHSVWWRTEARAAATFAPPWTLMLGFSAALLLLSALAALGPAMRASRLPPAVAVRHVE